MSFPTGEIWIGDYVRAMHKLKISSAELHGFVGRLTKVTVGPTQDRHKKDDDITVPDLSDFKIQDRSQKPPPPPAPKQQQDIFPPAMPTAEKLKPAGHRQQNSTTSNNEQQITITPLEEFDQQKHLNPPPLLEPLYPFPRSRALLSRIAAVQQPGTAINIPLLVETLARFAPIKELPCLPKWTTARGALVMIDLSEGMQLFHADQKSFAEELKKCVGDEAVRIKYFRHCPLDRCGEGAVWEWQPFEAPQNGTPIIILTDLGCAPTMDSRMSFDEEMWLNFIALAQKHDCRVIALVPYSRELWQDKKIARRIPIILWDRSVTISEIMRSLQAGRGDLNEF